MTTPFLGEIRMFAFGLIPKGWAACNGQLLPINQNQALFSLLGTTYGGNGQTNFALPDLRDHAPVHQDNSTVSIGQRGGEASHTLNLSELPAHTHDVNARSTATTDTPTGAMWAQTTSAGYATSPNSPMAAGTVGATGSTQPHENMPPYLVVTFAIALQGIFPSQN